MPSWSFYSRDLSQGRDQLKQMRHQGAKLKEALEDSAPSRPQLDMVHHHFGGHGFSPGHLLFSLGGGPPESALVQSSPDESMYIMIENHCVIDLDQETFKISSPAFFKII